LRIDTGKHLTMSSAGGKALLKIQGGVTLDPPGMEFPLAGYSA
jgi:hypothetical protein